MCSKGSATVSRYAAPTFHVRVKHPLKLFVDICVLQLVLSVVSKLERMLEEEVLERFLQEQAGVSPGRARRPRLCQSSVEKSAMVTWKFLCEMNSTRACIVGSL